MDAVMGNEQGPTVDRWNDGTCGMCIDDEQSRRRPCRSATRTSWFRYGGWRLCNNV